MTALDAERLCVGSETAPTTGTPHLQGYVRFAQPKTLAQMRKLIPRAHLEARKGTETQAATYCQKEAILIDKGVNFDERPKRHRDEEAAEVIEELKRAKYGQVRQRHPIFFFWHRAHIKGWLQDEIAPNVVQADSCSEASPLRPQA